MGNPRRFFVTVAYDGTAFQGWQVQPGARTVQSEIESSLARVSRGKPTRVHASGRTDTGVHARGQVVHFDSPRGDFDAPTWRRALNGVLPHDIRAMEVREVPPGFHARFSALHKEYRYFVHTGEVMPPDLRHTRLHEPRPLDVKTMSEACGLLRGEHDFTSFSAVRGHPGENGTRTLHEFTLREDAGGFCFLAVANGFLYKMVRQLVGALLRVGRGELAVADIARLLAEPARTPATVTAPPQGLFLWRVTYPEFPPCPR